MSGNSRHGKGRRFHYSKKSKALRRQGTAPGVSPATAGMPEVSRPAAAATTPLVPKAAAISKAKTTENPYPYIASELRRIAILGGIIIIILVVLVVVLT
jgi:hypothetical protein